MGCSVTANGNIIMSTHPLQRVEMEVTDLHVLGKCDQQVMVVPFSVGHRNCWVITGLPLQASCEVH